MPLSWNEIRHNAVKFARDYKTSTSESADKQTFWNEFFDVFGISRKLVASFEVPVLKATGNFGKIDLLWKRKLLVEHKSAGEDLGKARTQAFDYIQAMAAEGREKDIPRYVIVSDFQRFVLYDLEPETQRDLPLFAGRRYEATEFPLAELHRHIHAFAFIPGYKQHTFKEQDPINIEAAEILGKLHDELEAGGYTGHDLERFLVRIVFCLFAEDTGLFEPDSFQLYIENRTAPDGSDLGLHLARLFDVLNKPREKRQANLDEDLAQFPYVNGDLFADALGFADFNRPMRDALLECCGKDWDKISPAIFGSLFQSIMQPKERRQIGAHYTSERDILKVARSLFLDDLRAEFEKITGRPLDADGARPSGRFNVETAVASSDSKITPADTRTVKRAEARAPLTGARRARMEEFHKKICSLRFLDPACGCGNFLVITYRELRQLELEILTALYGGQKELTLDEVNRVSQVDVDQFYGIEIEEWPSRIAEVALWLMDHQMNQKISTAFGQLYQRLPLKKAPHIHCANALRLDWKTVLPPDQCSYVLGNPPFVGKKEQNVEQKADMAFVCGDVKGNGVLDFVTAWYFKAAEYIKETRIVVGFVSTTSISQGEQVSILWNELFSHYRLKIHFAHRTFKWGSEARGKAHVHVVIVGFATFDSAKKIIYDYESEEVTATPAKNISPYLIEGNDSFVTARSKPICNVPEIMEGSALIDDGHLLLSESEAAELSKSFPPVKKWLRPFFSGDDFINGSRRICLWLENADPSELRECLPVMQRIEAVKEFRSKSDRAATKVLALTPKLFGELRQPRNHYLFLPKTSSERRRFAPIGFMPPDAVINNTSLFIDGAELFHFGVISSTLHMAWFRQVCGRLESRYRYSNKIVYNNYPWPEKATDKQRAVVAAKAQAVLDARAKYMVGTARCAVPVAERSVGRRNEPASDPLISDASAPAGAGTAQRTVPTTACTLADLYDPLSMPPELVQAHAELDRAVEKCYRPEPFKSDRERVEYLFSLYEKLTAPLLPATPKAKTRRSKTTAL